MSDPARSVVSAFGHSVGFACTEPRFYLGEDAAGIPCNQEHPTTALLAQRFPAEMVIEKIDDRSWPLHVSRRYARCLDRVQGRERIPIIRFGEQAASERGAAGKMLGNSRAMIAIHDDCGLLQQAAAVERLQQVIEHD